MPRKPKILFLLNRLNPGTGPFQRAIRFDDERVDVTILSCYDSTLEVREKAARQIDEFGNKKIIGFGENSSKIRLVQKLYNYIRTENPDIIQTCHTFSTLAAIACKLVLRKPLVVHFEPTLFSNMGARRIPMQLALSACEGIICVSKATFNANAFSESIMRRNQDRRVIYNGVDHKQLAAQNDPEFRSRHGIPKDAFLIGCVADLKPVKDYPTLIKGFAEASQTMENAALVLIGAGELKDELVALSSRLGVADKVFFTGQIERLEVYAALKHLDLFVMASLVEGLSESIAQAMSAGLPIIVSDIAPIGKKASTK